MGIQLKRSLSENIDNDYVLEQGQFGIEMPQSLNTEESPFRVKIGDGVTPWKTLPYFKGYDPLGIVPKIFNLPTPTLSKYVFEGDEITVSLEGFDSSYMTMSGDLTADAPGNYTIQIALKIGGTWWDGTTESKSVVWKVVMQTVVLPTPTVSSFPLTGDAVTPTFNNFDESKMSISGDTSATDPGVYTVEFTPNKGWYWEDTKTNESRQVEWVLGSIDVAIPAVSGSFTWNGSAKSPTITGYDPDVMTQSGDTSATEPGTYTVTYTLKNTAVYKWADGTTAAKSFSWTIGKATPTLTLSKTSIELLQSNSDTFAITYDGDGSLSASSNYTSRATVTLSGKNAIVTAGSSYTGNATITVSASEGTHYTAISATCTVKVTEPTFDLELDLKNVAFNGQLVIYAFDQYYENYDSYKVVYSERETSSTSYPRTVQIPESKRPKNGQTVVVSRSVTSSGNCAAVKFTWSGQTKLTALGDDMNPFYQSTGAYVMATNKYSGTYVLRYADGTTKTLGSCRNSYLVMDNGLSYFQTLDISGTSQTGYGSLEGSMYLGMFGVFAAR